MRSDDEDDDTSVELPPCRLCKGAQFVVTTMARDGKREAANLLQCANCSRYGVCFVRHGVLHAW